MKHYLLFLSATIILFAACNNNKNDGKGKTSQKDSTALKEDLKKKATEANDKMVAALQALVPATEEELKSVFPETVMGASLSDYSFSSSMGASTATGNYKVNDSVALVLSIYDCAGEGGVGIYNLQYAGQLDYQTDNENEYTKVIDYNGHKAIESCRKTSAECTFTWFDGKRYLLMLESNGIDAGELKKTAKQIR